MNPGASILSSFFFFSALSFILYSLWYFGHTYLSWWHSWDSSSVVDIFTSLFLIHNTFSSWITFPLPLVRWSLALVSCSDWQSDSGGDCRSAIKSLCSSCILTFLHIFSLQSSLRPPFLKKTIFLRMNCSLGTGRWHTMPKWVNPHLVFGDKEDESFIQHATWDSTHTPDRLIAAQLL